MEFWAALHFWRKPIEAYGTMGGFPMEFATAHNLMQALYFSRNHRETEWKDTQVLIA